VKWFLLSFLILPSAFACWRLTGTAVIEGHAVNIDQKMNHDQTYSVMADSFILNMKIPSQGSATIVYDIKQRKKLELISVSSGKIPMKIGVAQEVKADGLLFNGSLSSI
jgi:hypothetical protein